MPCRSEHSTWSCTSTRMSPLHFHTHFKYDPYTPTHVRTRPVRTNCRPETRPKYDMRAQHPDSMGDPAKHHAPKNLETACDATLSRMGTQSLRPGGVDDPALWACALKSPIKYSNIPRTATGTDFTLHDLEAACLRALDLLSQACWKASPRLQQACEADSNWVHML